MVDVAYLVPALVAVLTGRTGPARRIDRLFRWSAAFIGLPVASVANVLCGYQLGGHSGAVIDG